MAMERLASLRQRNLLSQLRAPRGRAGASGVASKCIGTGGVSGATKETPLLLRGKYAAEARRAWEAVATACVLSREAQRAVVASAGTAAETKSDLSPVTVGDYGVQALVCWYLGETHDEEGQGAAALRVVAEETSETLRSEEGATTLALITDAFNGALCAASSSAAAADMLLASRMVAPDVRGDDVLQYIDLGGDEGGRRGRVWVLDPIDGTIGFVSGRQYAIALALLEDGIPVLGVLGCPNLDRNATAPPSTDGSNAGGAGGGGEGGRGSMFVAVRGEGAFVGDCFPADSTSIVHDGGTNASAVDAAARLRFPSQRIRMRTPASPEAALSDFLESCRFMESVVAAHSDHTLSSAVARILGVASEPVRIDSQAKYGALARGDGDMYMRFPKPGYREKIWDHAAGVVVITEAGGIVSTGAGDSLDFGGGRFLDNAHSGIVAGVPHVHPALVNAVKEARASTL